VRLDGGGNPLIAALDTADLDRLVALAAALGPHVGHLKVGLEAFAAHGPAAVRAAAEHAPVFCDLKLHDIPNTVAGAARAAAGLGVAMLTVHASGGAAMIAAAAEAAPHVAILGVTVLTSHPDAADAPRLARLAVDAGATGVVCAAPDVPGVREAVGPKVPIVVPGIRPPGAAAQDQARVATPRAAIDAGADYLVIGRPLTASADPAAAAAAILDELR
jgi:orotidine-5'-phosphate decarboxylase